jgi:spore photoproduct lyase
MLPINPKAVYTKSEAREDPRSMARIERMLPFMHFEGDPVVVDDAGLEQVIIDENLNVMPRHGREGPEVEPVVIFNQFLYHHTEEERDRRRERFPELVHGRWGGWYAGYLGFDWRSSGDEEYRERTGLVCQPAYALHSFWGCHYRCAYCNLGHVANIYVNLEDWIDHIREGLADLRNSPGQILFQWDNGTDIACWEPEYGGTKLLVDLFAEQPDKYLELYVGKSDHVDYLLDYDHRGHTVCCWSVSTPTQAREIEPRTASMEGRLQAARKCQEAGYPVRIRFSPMVPIAGWEEETRQMVRRMFELISPEVLTIEPLRFCTYEQVVDLFRSEVLDPEFLEGLRTLPEDSEDWQKSQFPDDLRIRMYRVVLEEVADGGAETPVALCREKRRVWEALTDELGRMGQAPDSYVCNCGPTSAGQNPLLAGSKPGRHGMTR